MDTLTTPNQGKDISRRGLIKGAAVAAVGAVAVGLVGCDTPASGETNGDVRPVGLPDTWDYEADVVIVGGGGAGLAAAVQATQSGSSSVLVIEKSSDTGGTTKISGGVIQAAGTSWQKELTDTQDDKPEKHFGYYRQAAEGIINEDLVRDMTIGAPGHIEWLNDLGITYQRVYDVDQIPYVDPDFMKPRIHVPVLVDGITIGGTVHTTALYDAADKGGVEFLFDTTVTDVIFDSEIGVVGVVAGGKNIKASRGVILAAGSFDYDEDLARAFSPQQFFDLQLGVSRVPATNTGDGIKLGMKLGAALDSLGGTISLASNGSGPGIITVNKAGQRFVAETGHYSYVARAVFQQVKQLDYPVHMIFGQNALDNDIGNRWATGDALRNALSDGKMQTAPTLDEVAAAIGVDADNLKETIERWNADVAAGADSKFARQVGLSAIEAPYYFQEVTFSNLGCLGGLKINLDTQVLNLSGDAIPRLYAAGVNSGGWFGPYYPGSGTAVLGTVHWGRRAADSVLALDPWD
jgi:fumarate reductase flavoprotein subunit